MMGSGYGYGGFGMGGDSLMMILVILVIGYLFYMAINNNKKAEDEKVNRSQQVQSSKAIEIAKSRLARGEISFEEFEQIQKNLL